MTFVCQHLKTMGWGCDNSIESAEHTSLRSADHFFVLFPETFTPSWPQNEDVIAKADTGGGAFERSVSNVTWSLDAFLLSP